VQPHPLFLVALLGAFLRSQTFVVDAAMGAGAHFPDIASAVAAVPDGALVEVRPGTYGDFTIDGKSLVVSGLPGAHVVSPMLDVRVQNLGAAQAVTLRNLAFGSGHFAALPGSLRCTNNAGRVVVQSCVFVPFGWSQGASIVAQGCADLHVVDVVLLGSGAHAVALQSSRAVLSGCVIESLVSFSIGGVSLLASRCDVTDCAITAMGVGVASSPIVMHSPNCDVTVRDGSTLRTVAGPSLFPQPLVAGTFGGSVRIDPNVQLLSGSGPRFDPAVAVTFVAMPRVTAVPAALSGTASATLTLPPGAVGGLWLGLAAAPATVPPFGTPVHVDPAAAVPVTAGTATVQTAAIPLPSLPALRGVSLAWQGASFAAATGPQASNAAVFTLW
jgi:hypothetical protein